MIPSGTVKLSQVFQAMVAHIKVVPRKPAAPVATLPPPAVHKFCGDCGCKLDAGIKFCGECGAKVPPPEPVATPTPSAAELAEAEEAERAAMAAMQAEGPGKAGIVDWSLRQTSMEEVFLRIAHASEVAFMKEFNDELDKRQESEKSKGSKQVAPANKDKGKGRQEI